MWPYSLFGRVCVIETNDQLSLVHLCEVLIKHRSLGMTDVKVTAGLRRETSDDFADFGVLEAQGEGRGGFSFLRFGLDL